MERFMKLFVDSNYLSPYAMSAYVALREKGLTFELQPVNLQEGEQRSAAYGALSTTQRVPTFSDGAFSLSESSAIAEYIDEAFPGPHLYPVDPRNKAKAREVQAWLRSDLAAIRQERSTEIVFLGRTAPPLSSAAQAAANKLFNAVERLLPHGQQTLFGQWCIADTDLALMLNRLVLGGDAVPERLAAYANAQWQRPSVQAWVEMSRSAT
jgi:glutathione S-transferase